MTTTITGTEAHVPDLFELYAWQRESGNTETAISGTQDPADTLRGSGPRRGTFRALFASLDAALACDSDLAGARTFTLTDTDRPQFNMTFVVPEGGKHGVEISQTRRSWHLTFDFREKA